jgi:2-polyprenyl-6-methoxyphenol hydroxylase-like FAD-dependent oxidoreductase
MAIRSTVGLARICTYVSHADIYVSIPRCSLDPTYLLLERNSLTVRNAVFSTIKNGSDCCWVLTHPDEHNIDESWSFPGKLAEVKEAIKDWDPLCTRIVSKTPEEMLVDWKLVYRDPLPTWVSPKARILLLGDSAHPFLPTSAQGATQALEDGGK